MNRELFVDLYGKLWTDGVWATSWGKAVADLSAAQAAWRPTPERKSVWQFASHVTFWRNFQLARLKDPNLPMPAEDVLATQWAQPDSPTSADWDAARRRLEESQRAIVAAAADPAVPLEKVAPVMAHDAYHLGQVMYVRAMQGLPPIE